MIDILVPVLGRPQNVQPLLDSAAAATVNPHRVLFIATAGDRQEIAALEKAGAEYLIHPEKAGPGNYARKINAGFKAGESEFVFQAADDIEFTPRWAELALKMMVGTVGVVATNDMANREVMRGIHGTHNLIRRSYIEEYGGTFDNTPGVVLYEGYDHWYVDRELCDQARTRKAFAFAKTSVVRHHHPIYDRTVATDDTYRKGQARAREDHTLYMQRSPLFRTRRQGRVRR